MSDYALVPGTYIEPSPMGAFHAVSSAEEDATRRILRGLLAADLTLPADDEGIAKLAAESGVEDIEDILFRMQKLRYLRGSDSPRRLPREAIEDVVSKQLAMLSAKRKGVLADAQGLYVASAGFPHETAGELAAAATEFAAAYEKRRGVFEKNLGIDSSAIGLLSASAACRIGFWQLYVGDTRFTLVVDGPPLFNQDAFTTLIWALYNRYGRSRTDARN